MRLATAFFLAAALAVSCGGNTSRAKQAAAPAVDPKDYTYRIVATYPHDTTAYTEGLQYVDGTLWEGAGQNGQSRIQHTDLATGQTSVFVRNTDTDFGEGITLLDGKLYQLTWQSNRAYVYDIKTGNLLATYQYPGEGWGLTTDGAKLYMSDGTSNIYTLDPATFKREKHVTVTYNGEPVNYLNELEWIDGKIWANVYTTDRIVIIDPATGVVEGVIDLSGLLPEIDRTPTTDVLNGIAYDAAGKRIFVTGKNWPKIFEIKIIEQ